MARIKINVDKNELQKIIAELESKHKFDNLNALWKAVEATDWAKNYQPKPITASVALLRVKELNIATQTKAGRRGRQGGVPCVPGVPRVRVPRKQKMKKFLSSFELMRKEIPVKYHGVIERAESGSVKAMIRLKCLDCSCWQPAEIKICPCTSCSLYPVRPFQGKIE